MPDIVLATLNARYAHASLGLRCLAANLAELAPRATLLEFVIGQRTEDVAERILAHEPAIVGLGVYVWNADESHRLVAMLKTLRPGLTLVLGGPEVSHEPHAQPIVALADHVIAGAADLAFAELCRTRLTAGAAPPPKLIDAGVPPLDALALPYERYDEQDIAHRTLYVEASRGCPFKCEFCLSALDRTAWPFELERFVPALEALHRRGARRFKFVDRTFNLRVQSSLRILEFFLEKLERAPHDPVYAHFEMVPDHLPDPLRDAIARFPAGTLQLEIGIQTWNPQVQRLISRRQDNARAEANLRWLRRHTAAHLHVDLIAGLPGEDLAGFGEGFDRLAALDPHEIQVGLLKRLRGAPIARHAHDYALRFSPHAPYTVLATDRLSFAEVQRLHRYARYWELIGNSGRFAHSRPLLLGGAPFARFMALSDWLWAHTDATNRLSLERQYALVHRWLHEEGRQPASEIDACIERDRARSRLHGPRAGGDRSRTWHAAPERQRRQLAGTPDVS